MSLRQAALHPYTEKFSMGHVGVVLVGPPPDEVLARMPERAVIAPLHELDAPHALHATVDGALERVELRIAAERRSRSIRRYRYELSELVEIARAITQERNIDRLLDLILEKSRFITGADAGSIYVVETTDDGRAAPSLQAQPERVLRLRVQRVHHRGVDALDRGRRRGHPPRRSTSRTSTRSATTQPFGFDRSFDERVGYRTKSMITMPMISAEDEVIGVIQLINKKRVPEKRLPTPEDVEQEVIPFDPSEPGSARRPCARRPASRSRTRSSTTRSAASSRASCAPACRRSSSAIRPRAVTRCA